MNSAMTESSSALRLVVSPGLVTQFSDMVNPHPNPLPGVPRRGSEFGLRLP